LVGEEVVAAMARLPARAIEPEDKRLANACLKMKNPDTFNGKSTTPFSIWWKLVIQYLGFYPATGERQKITWVGTLLMGTVKVRELHWYDLLGDADTWANYLVDIQVEYLDTHDSADAQLKLAQIKFSGNIRVYLTEFRALNNYAQATGQCLQEKIDLAMPSAILKIRFSH
jgi:hypothetical protein